MEKETFPIDIKLITTLITQAEIKRASNGKYALVVMLSGDVPIDEHRTLSLANRKLATRGELKGRKPNPQWERMRKADNSKETK